MDAMRNIRVPGDVGASDGERRNGKVVVPTFKR